MPLVLAIVLSTFVIHHAAHAITIDIEYSTDFGGDESPSWDASGSILIQHFQAAKAIWESLIPGPGNFEFDFQWDDDIPGAGLATDLGAIDQYIEINPTVIWFADPTPSDNSEFNFTQSLFRDLNSTQQSDWFPGTNPPATLETGFNGAGDSTATASGQLIGGMPATAANGADLLSVILHEIGHILGISGIEPGEYNVFPQHVGGLTDVLVKESENDGIFESHLAGDGTAPWLMDSTQIIGFRTLPSATDVLVIAEDQGITNVRPERVGSISSGLWSQTNRWIGGAVPNQNQDVYISHGGTTTLDINGHVRDLRIDPGNSFVGGSNQIIVDGTLTLDGATVSVASGGNITANTIAQGLGSFSTAAGSMVRFNNYTSGISSTASFNGSVGIGFDNPGPTPATFDPSFITSMNVGEALRVGDAGTTTTFVIDNGMNVTSGTARIGTDFNGGGEGQVDLNGVGSSWNIGGVLDGRNGLLSVTGQAQLESGSVFLGDDNGEMRAGVDGVGSVWNVNGNVDIGPSILTGNGQGGLTVQNDGLVTVSGNVDVHGTNSIQSFVVVQGDGTLDVDGTITVGPFGSVQLLGSTIRTGRLVPFLGTFTWTNGTLELTNQAVTMDSSLPPNPLPASMAMQNKQKLILSGAGRDLTIGDTATGQLEMFDTTAVEVNDGDVFLARNAGSTGKLLQMSPNTSVFVNGAMAVGGTQTSSGGTGQLVVDGEVTVTETLTYWPGSSVQVNPSAGLSADILNRGGGTGGGLSVGTNGRVRFNKLQGFGNNISLGGISMVGIAEGDTNQGTLVRNANQRYSFREGWIIGDNAVANVDLLGGGEATGDGFVHLGNLPGAGGTVLDIDGVDSFGKPSQLLVINETPQSDSLIVGVRAKATMNVTNGGHVRSGGAIVSHTKSATGSAALVSGSGSDWDVDGHLIVGGGTEGMVTVEGKGLLDVQQSLWIGGAPKEIGGNGDPTAGGVIPSLVRITDPGSLGNVGFDTFVGYDLAGELVVEGRGELHNDFSGYIGYEKTAKDSSAVVSTRGGWDVGNDLFVGYQSRGMLTIDSEGAVKVGTNPSIPGGDAEIGVLQDAAGSWAHVTDSATWQIGSNLTVGNLGQGELMLDNRGKVTIGGNVYIGREATATGSLANVVTESIFDIGVDLRVGDKTMGQLSVDSGGLVNVLGNALVGAGSASGDGLIALAGNDETIPTLQVQGGLYVGGFASDAGRGVVDMQGKTLVQANGGTIWSQGEIHLGGTLDVGALPLQNRGLLAGSGRVDGNVQNRGNVSPGNSSVGTIAMLDSFSQFPAGDISIDLDATEHDQLLFDAGGTINGGELIVQLLNGFQPGLGAEFPIFSFAGILAGAGFNTFDLPMLGSGLSWDTGDLLTTGILSVVPSLPGDFDFDGDVDGRDFLVWQQGGSYTPNSPADLVTWQANYGSVAPPLAPISAAVPEPAGLILLVLGLCGLGFVRNSELCRYSQRRAQ